MEGHKVLHEECLNVLTMSGKYELKQATENDGSDVTQEINDVEETPDDILIKLGGCGRYQILLSFVIQLMKVVSCFSMSGNAFFAYVPHWRCSDDTTGQNATRNVTSSAVNNTVDVIWSEECAPNGQKCSTFEFDPSISTLVNQFDLVCDNSWVTATIISVQMAGMSVGSVLVGPVADIFGRRHPYMVGVLLIGVGHAVAYFPVHWIMYAVAKFFIGVGCAFYLSIYCTLQSEYTLSKWRAVIISFPSWALESSLFALLAYLIHDWQYMTLLIAAVSFIFLFLWGFIPESFRWYVSKDRFSEAEETVKNVARWNRHQLPDFDRMRKTLVSHQAQDSASKLSVLALFKAKALLKLTIPLTVVWLSLGLISYGVNFGIQKLSGDIYLNLFLFSAASIPSKIVSILLANKFGRRVSAILAFSFSGLGGLVVGIVQNTDYKYKDVLTNYCALAASSGVDWAWGPVQTMTQEVYPTVVRNTGFGVLSFLARVGAIIGPQLVYLSDFAPGLLYFVVAGIALLSIIGVLCLPETMDTELIDKMASDLDNIRKKEHTV